jgi:sulfur carrier protein ThiS
MVNLTLPMYLASLLQDEAASAGTKHRSITLASGTWLDLARELERRFPALAHRLMPDWPALGRGFVLVRNDEIVRSVTSVDLRSGDQLTIIAAVAGG